MVNVSFWLLHVTCGWKRGSPQPGPLPKGYLRVSLPQFLWQICDEIREGSSRRKMERRSEGLVKSIVVVVMRMGNKGKW